MPLTAFQLEVARLLAENRTPDSYLAGAAALHLEPRSLRYSNDLDYFHDSAERVGSAFDADRSTLVAAGLTVAVAMNQPGFVRAVVRRDDAATKVEWAHDTAWRFLPVLVDEQVGYRLHPIDLAINKVLALVGRNEPRDFLDTLDVHERTLSLGALVWAAVGKDPGFTPASLLELLRRRGAHRPEDFARLRLLDAVDLPATKTRWTSALDEAEHFVRTLPHDAIGCLFYSTQTRAFVTPAAAELATVHRHYGAPGGVLPAIVA